MDVRQAVKIAKQHIVDLYADEQLTNLGLEEVEFDDQANVWNVTVGFSRPWQTATAFAEAPRSYMQVVIPDAGGSVKAVRNRLPAA